MVPKYDLIDDIIFILRTGSFTNSLFLSPYSSMYYLNSGKHSLITLTAQFTIIRYLSDTVGITQDTEKPEIFLCCMLVSVVCNNVIAGARIIDKLSLLHLFVQSKELCRGDTGS